MKTLKLWIAALHISPSRYSTYHFQMHILWSWERLDEIFDVRIVAVICRSCRICMKIPAVAFRCVWRGENIESDIMNRGKNISAFLSTPAISWLCSRRGCFRGWSSERKFGPDSESPDFEPNSCSLVGHNQGKRKIHWKFHNEFCVIDGGANRHAVSGAHPTF